MKSLIQSIDSWRTKTAAELTTIFNTASVEVTDDQLYTWAGVALIAGPTGAEQFRQALEQNGMGWAVHQLGGSGLQLSHPLSQQMLLGFAQAGVPGCAALAAVGRRLVSPWVAAGNSGQVSEQQVTAGLLAIRKEELIEAKRDQFEQWRVAINEWDGSGDPPVMGG